MGTILASIIIVMCEGNRKKVKTRSMYTVYRPLDNHIVVIDIVQSCASCSVANAYYFILLPAPWKLTLEVGQLSGN